jgi:hypothetical protein
VHDSGAGFGEVVDKIGRQIRIKIIHRFTHQLSGSNTWVSASNKHLKTNT